MRDGRADSSAEAPVRERIETGLVEIFGSFESAPCGSADAPRDPPGPVGSANEPDRSSRSDGYRLAPRPRCGRPGRIASRSSTARLISRIWEAARDFQACPSPSCGRSCASSWSSRARSVTTSNERRAGSSASNASLPSSAARTKSRPDPATSSLPRPWPNPKQALASMQTLGAGRRDADSARGRDGRRDPGLPTSMAPLERRSYRVPFTGVSRQLWVARVLSELTRDERFLVRRARLSRHVHHSQPGQVCVKKRGAASVALRHRRFVRGGPARTSVPLAASIETPHGHRNPSSSQS